MPTPSGVSTSKERTAAGQSEQERGRVGTDPGAAAGQGALAGPAAVLEGEDALRADSLIGLLQNPVLGADLPCHVAGNLGEGAGKGVIRGIHDAPGLADADSAEEAFNAGEGVDGPLRRVGGGEAES